MHEPARRAGPPPGATGHGEGARVSKRVMDSMPGSGVASGPSPLAGEHEGAAEDPTLVARVRAGDREAVERLVRRHQRWIYNVALRMLGHAQDAEDATQEILLKAVTRLSTFEARSRFRTWLYRIAVNHLLNVRRGRREPAGLTFRCYGHGLDATADDDVRDDATAPPDVRLLAEEARLTCTAGMLLCLEREQRLAYVLGEIFGVTDAVGAELLEIGRDAFRQRLARARRDLHQFMHDKCGLVNRANPCRCARKTRGFVEAGYVDPGRLVFAVEHLERVRDVAPTRAEELAALDARYAGVFRDAPFAAGPDLVRRLCQVLDEPASAFGARTATGPGAIRALEPGAQSPAR